MENALARPARSRDITDGDWDKIQSRSRSSDCPEEIWQAREEREADDWLKSL
jgi:hypothetical protein